MKFTFSIFVFFSFAILGFTQSDQQILKPADIVKIKDSLLTDPFRVTHYEKYYYPFWNLIEYTTEKGSYTWRIELDKDSNVINEGLIGSGDMPVGEHVFYDAKKQVIKTYNYYTNELVYKNGYMDRYKSTIDSLMSVTDKYLVQKFGQVFFDQHINHVPKFSWATKADPYGRFPNYPDTIPSSLVWTYEIFGNDLSYTAEIEFRAEKFQLTNDLVVSAENYNNNWITLSSFDPKPINYDFVRTKKMLKSFGYSNDPEIFYDTLNHQFFWTCTRVKEIIEDEPYRIREVKISSYSGKYSVREYVLGMAEIPCAGYISFSDSFCIHQPPKYSADLKSYSFYGSTIELPKDFYKFSWTNKYSNTMLVTDKNDSLISYKTYDEDMVFYAEDGVDYEYYDPACAKSIGGKRIMNSSIDTVRSWIDTDRLCKKTLDMFFLRRKNSTDLVLRVIEFGVYYAFNNIYNIVIIKNVDENDMKKWKPILERFYFY